MAEIHYICLQYFKDEKMKKGFNILLIVCAALLTLSCSKTKSYTDMLNDEKKAIDQLIAREGIEVLKDFPKDSVFEPNQFVILDNGVYLNIVDRGDNDRAVLNKTRILARFSAIMFTKNDTSTIYSNYGPSGGKYGPVEFIYGQYDPLSPPTSNDLTDYTYELQLNYLLSEGMETGLQYVGNKGKVKLIVPFKVGTSDQQQSGYTVYYRIIQYKFADKL